VSAAPAPGVTDDERRTIAEMMAKGTYGPETVLEACKYEDSSRLLAPAMGPERASADDFLLGGVGQGRACKGRER
jgi:hypothetical protein